MAERMGPAQWYTFTMVHSQRRTQPHTALTCGQYFEPQKSSLEILWVFESIFFYAVLPTPPPLIGG